MKTNWFLSLIANSFAVALAILINSLYTTEKSKSRKNKPQSSFKLKDYGLSFALSIMGAFLAYSFVYALAGYLPMTRQWSGLIHNVNTRVVPLWEQISTYQTEN